MTGPIDRLGVLAIRGADALAFSHSQLANDVKALPNGHWQWNTLLQIQGRVLALMLLARVADDEILLVVPRDVRSDVRSTLARYVLRSKVRLDEDDALRVEGTLETPEPRGADAVARGGTIEIGDGTLGIPLGGRQSRRLVIEPARGAPDASVDDEWRAADIEDGIPWVQAGTAGEFIPQALGLDRLAAYSVSKGCYPGQEIVARTHFLGRNKRALRRFSGYAADHLPAAGDRLHVTADGTGDPVAVVIDAMAVDGRLAGLAVSRDREATDACWLGGGAPVPIELRAP